MVGSISSTLNSNFKQNTYNAYNTQSWKPQNFDIMLHFVTYFQLYIL